MKSQEMKCILYLFNGLWLLVAIAKNSLLLAKSGDFAELVRVRFVDITAFKKNKAHKNQILHALFQIYNMELLWKNLKALI